MPNTRKPPVPHAPGDRRSLARYPLRYQRRMTLPRSLVLRTLVSCDPPDESALRQFEAQVGGYWIAIAIRKRSTALM